MMTNMHHGRGNRHKKKTNKIGTIHKMVSMMIMCNKRNCTKHKKQKICNHKCNIN